MFQFAYHLVADMSEFPYWGILKVIPFSDLVINDVLVTLRVK